MAAEKKILKVLDTIAGPQVQKATIESITNGDSAPRDNLQSIIDSRNVLAVGISEKISKKKKTGKLALTFYVEKKIPLKKLKESQKIPKTVPREISGRTTVLTDVVAIGKLKPELNVTRKPFQPGHSIGHFKLDGGTFGALVKDKKGKIYILSNSHVLADSGFGKKGDHILYPGAFDKGKQPADVRAKLHKFVPLAKGKDFPNLVDCAIAIPLTEHLAELMAEIKGIGLPKGIIKAKRGMKVVKVGRTTGKTTSEVTDVNFRAMVDYKKHGLGELRFRDQIWCKKKYTDGGDSGSLIIDRASGKAVGLHFAGAQGGSAHNPIDKVLKALGVTLVTKKLKKPK
jgi:hypothetical protein